MIPEPSETLPAEAVLALAHTAPDRRGALRIFLELDARLARIVAATTEPILGQMRLAWWRDTLTAPVEQRPIGDAVLDGVAEYWPAQDGSLVHLVDGWEHMLAQDLDQAAARQFAAGRAAPFRAIAELPSGGTGLAQECVRMQRWALVDASVHVPAGAERDTLFQLAREIEGPARFPGPLRGLSVLDALARRSIERGGLPLMEGRGAALAATRAAFFGS